MTYRNLAIAIGMTLLMVACGQVAKIGGEPFVTETPDNLPQAKGQEYVSICYNADTTTRRAVETLAADSCKTPALGVKFFSHDMIFNDCPVVTKARVTFLCVAPKK